MIPMLCSLWNQPSIHNIEQQTDRIGAQKQQIISGVEYLNTQAPNAPNCGQAQPLALYLLMPHQASAQSPLAFDRYRYQG